jgi:uncharacterized protein
MNQLPPSGAAPALPQDVRNWAISAHLSAFIGAWLALAFMGPLVVWLIKREGHPFIAMHAREALNFNLSMLIYGVVAVLLSLLLVGIPILVGIVIAWFVLTVIAAVKASNGEEYHYPLTIQFVQ